VRTASVACRLRLRIKTNVRGFQVSFYHFPSGRQANTARSEGSIFWSVAFSVRFHTASAIKRHSLVPSLKPSGVGSSQEPAIRFAMLKYCLSALRIIQVRYSEGSSALHTRHSKVLDRKERAPPTPEDGKAANSRATKIDELDSTRLLSTSIYKSSLAKYI
jgi:hypothetical protein